MVSNFRANTFKRQGRNIWVSAGDSPSVGSYSNPSPDPRLGGFFADPDAAALIVLQMGTVVAQNTDGYLVPCNSGVAAEMTHNAMDVQYGVLAQNLVDQAAAGGKFAMEANAPLGWVIYDTLQNANALDPYGHHQTDLGQENPTIKLEGLIMMPVIYKTDGSKYDFKVGDDVVGDGAPDKTENPVAWLGMPRKMAYDQFDAGGLRTVKGDAPNMKVGKIVAVESDYEFNKGGLQYVQADGIQVSSDSTKGFSPYIWDAFKTIDDTYKKKIVWIKITL